MPREAKVGDGYVTLQWTDGAANGLPILKRLLRITRADAGGTSTQVECASNTCTIDGLANGKNYWFQVTQSNELGSAESPESAPSKPDVIPENVGLPDVKFGNGQVTISWPTGVSRGSPITEYRVTMNSGGAAEPLTAASPATTLHWKGLTNDQDYTFTVAAKNAVGWSKDESPASVPEHPTGAPQAATAVVGADAGLETGQHINVDWQAAPIKKDPILRYEVFATRVGDGQKLKVGSIDTAGRQSGKFSILWAQAVNDVDYTFTVVAHNRGPDPGTESAPSAPVNAYGAPDTPRGANISAGDGSLQLSYGDPKQPKITEYEVVVHNGLTHEPVTEPVKVSVGSQIPGTFKNGTRYYAKLRAFNQTKGSDWGGTNSVTPVGAPNSPDVDPLGPPVPGDGAKRRVGWKFADAYLQGNTRDQVTIQYRTAGGGWTNVPNSSNYGSAGGGQFGHLEITTNGATVAVELRAVSDGHGASGPTSISVTPPLRVSHDPAANRLTLHAQGFGGNVFCDVTDPFKANNAKVDKDGSVTLDYAPPVGETPKPGPHAVSVSCRSSLLGGDYNLGPVTVGG